MYDLFSNLYICKVKCGLLSLSEFINTEHGLFPSTKKNHCAYDVFSGWLVSYFNILHENQVGTTDFKQIMNPWVKFERQYFFWKSATSTK